jgi:hypothetical protein
VKEERNRREGDRPIAVGRRVHDRNVLWRGSEVDERMNPFSQDNGGRRHREYREGQLETASPWRERANPIGSIPERK